MYNTYLVRHTTSVSSVLLRLYCIRKHTEELRRKHTIHAGGIKWESSFVDTPAVFGCQTVTYPLTLSINTRRRTILRDPSVNRGLIHCQNSINSNCCATGTTAVRQCTLSARRLDVGLWYFMCSVEVAFFFFGLSLEAPSPPVLVASPCG